MAHVRKEVALEAAHLFGRGFCDECGVTLFEKHRLHLFPFADVLDAADHTNGRPMRIFDEHAAMPNIQILSAGVSKSIFYFVPVPSGVCIRTCDVCSDSLDIFRVYSTVPPFLPQYLGCLLVVEAGERFERGSCSEAGLRSIQFLNDRGDRVCGCSKA